MNKNYKQIYEKKADLEKKIKSICPEIPNSSGIYVFYRRDEADIRRAYCGQAVNLCERCVSHLAEYDHIALSLKKHGFYCKDNPYGWRIAYKTCMKSELDKNEVETIKSLADKGFQMYNITAGGQSKGKIVSDVYKHPKTYRQGLEQGRKNIARELSHIIDMHLVVSIKPEKESNKISLKAFQKFKEILRKGASENE